MDAQLRIAVLGGSAAPLPPIVGIAWVSAEAQVGCDALLVTDPVSPTTWRELSRSLATTTPIAVLCEPGLRLPADFDAAAPTRAAIGEAVDAMRPIAHRLARLPCRGGANDADGAELAILALAYSRDLPIAAERWAGDAATVRYPLLADRPGMTALDPRSALETLADVDLLDRNFFARTNLCGRCGSARLAAYEACLDCGSANLAEESLIHHYRCGHQAGESAFAAGRELVCPKCRHRLRHFGVDYDRPGQIAHCRQCGHDMNEPRPDLQCLDCGKVTHGEQADMLDWFAYRLNDRGAAALHDGRLPHLNLAAIVRPYPRAYAPHEFRLLAGEQLIIAARYERPMSICTLRLTNGAEIRALLGVTGAAAALRLLTDIVAENVRGTDFFTVGRDDTIVLSMPETPVDTARSVLDRLCRAVRDTIEGPPHLDAAVADAEQSRRLVDALE